MRKFTLNTTGWRDLFYAHGFCNKSKSASKPTSNGIRSHCFRRIYLTLSFESAGFSKWKEEKKRFKQSKLWKDDCILRQENLFAAITENFLPLLNWKSRNSSDEINAKVPKYLKALKTFFLNIHTWWYVLTERQVSLCFLRKQSACNCLN